MTVTDEITKYQQEKDLQDGKKEHHRGGRMSCWPTSKQEFDSVYFFLPSDILENYFVSSTSHGPISYLPVFLKVVYAI